MSTTASMKSREGDVLPGVSSRTPMPTFSCLMDTAAENTLDWGMCHNTYFSPLKKANGFCSKKSNIQKIEGMLRFICP